MWTFYILALQVWFQAIQYIFLIIVTRFHHYIIPVKKKLIFIVVQAMVIVAWNGLGSPMDIFQKDLFEQALSIFITVAILRLV